MNVRPAREGTTRNGRHDARIPGNIWDILTLLFGGCFLGIALNLISLQISSPRAVSDTLSYVGSFFIVVVFWHKSTRFLLGALIVAAVLAFAVQSVVAPLLANLASNGVYGPDKSGRIYFYVENYLLFGVLWLLIGIPYRAFKYKLDRYGKGEAQCTLLGPLAMAAAVLTGIYILVLHLDKGPLSEVNTRINTRALIVGDIFTVVLIFPIFRSLAEGGWQHGVIGFLFPKPFRRNWRESSREIVAAVRLYKETPDSKSSHEDGSDHGEGRSATVPVEFWNMLTSPYLEGGIMQQENLGGGIMQQKRWQLELMPTRTYGSATFRLSSGSEAHDITWIFVAPLETIKVDGKAAVRRFRLTPSKEYHLSDLSSIIGSDVTVMFDQVRMLAPHRITVRIGNQILRYKFW